MKKFDKLVKIIKCELQEGFCVKLYFNNNDTKIVNLTSYMHGPIFEEIKRDRKRYEEIKIEGGTVSWPNGADIDPNVLYYDLTPAWKEQEVSVT